MRILHIIRPAGGGMRHHVEILITGLAMRGHEIGLVSPDEEWNSSLRAKEITTFWAPITDMPGFYDLSALSKLKRTIREFQPELLHCHGLRAAWLGRYINGLFHLPLVVTYHATLEGGGRLRRTLTITVERLISRRDQAAIAVSDWVRRDLERRLGLKGPRLVTILNGIDINRLIPTRPREETREMLGISPQEVLIGTIARLAKQKDLATLIRAARLVRENFSRAVFIVIGEGPERPYLERLVEKLSLSGRFIFLGYRHDIPELLSAMDLFVLSSRYEGAPLAVMEAMAMGLPVVATKAGGIPDLLPEGRAGFLVDVGDHVGLAERILWLSTAGELRARMGREAKAWADKYFSKERMIAATERLYERVLASISVENNGIILSPV